LSATAKLDNGVLRLRLDSPPGNILSRATCEVLTEAVAEHGNDRHLKAILFEAAGKNFSYGASVEEHVPGEVDRFLPAFHALFLKLADAGVPTIAAVRGLCLGGAFELVSFCDLILAEEGTRFGLPEITLGVFPPAACVFLPWRAGAAIAQDLILTGRHLKTAEAARRGIVSRVCAAADLERSLEALLDEEIRPQSAAALRIAVRASRGEFHATLKDRLDAVERLYLDDLMSTRDAREGIEAFLEKRQPVWSNT